MSMHLVAQKSQLHGDVKIPGSKSHTIRGLVLATLADGKSRLRDPLDSLDTRAAVEACRKFGAIINTDDPKGWTIEGIDGKPWVPADVIDVKNSGTTLYVMLAMAALGREGWSVFTGDEQIRRRPAEPLIRSLEDLGAEIISTRGDGMCPLVVRGPLEGGETLVEGVTSQYVSAILLNAPFSEGDTEMRVDPVNEKPYIQMTLDWMRAVGLDVEDEQDFFAFKMPGGQSIKR
ncbi:MAG: 3-phosphoshikimate 1-carboxyvinyltransferase, partial [Candidatus Sumerlaeota bacterium]